MILAAKFEIFGCNDFVPVVAALFNFYFKYFERRPPLLSCHFYTVSTAPTTFSLLLSLMTLHQSRNNP